MGRFPSEYMGALVQGQALGGIIAVGTNVVMLTLGLDDVRCTKLIIFLFFTLSWYFEFLRVSPFMKHTSFNAIE
jgi:hypothetical protein